MVDVVLPAYRIKLASIFVFLPLWAGGSIYLLFRAKSLLMFSWVEAIRVDEEIEGLRLLLLPAKSYLPTWFVYSLPGALWTFSMLWFFSLIWWDEGSRDSFWISAAMLVSLGMELGQLMGLVPGTFGFSDLGGIGAAYVLFVFLRKRVRVNQNEN